MFAPEMDKIFNVSAGTDSIFRAEYVNVEAGERVSG